MNWGRLVLQQRTYRKKYRTSRIKCTEARKYFGGHEYAVYFEIRTRAEVPLHILHVMLECWLRWKSGDRHATSTSHTSSHGD